MRKLWEAIALFVVVIILISIASDAIVPFLPAVGIATAALILIAISVLLFRLVIARRKFW